MKRFVPGLAAVLLLAGCGTQMPGYPVAPLLPPDSIPLPPVSEQQLIWRPGDWVYVDGSYRYEAGRYEPRGDHGALWTRGHWAGTAGRAVWISGGWS